MLKAIVAFGLTRRAIVLLGLVVFIAAGLVAFTKLNIEAYPNPAPVILEITAQALGLSAEEMERYYTVPMEVGLYITPGVDNVRSTSFYGLSFVRVVVGGMLIGPIILLIVVPALQTYFLERADRATPEPPETISDAPQPAE